jgi:hypothetical protein
VVDQIFELTKANQIIHNNEMTKNCLDTNKAIGMLTWKTCIPEKRSQRWTFYHKVLLLSFYILNF